MSGVLHPVGPEPSETYWVRRAVVIGVALVLVIILMIALFNLGGGSQAAPAATPGPLLPSTSATPTPSSTPSSSSSTTPSSTSSSTPTDTASSEPSASSKKSSEASEKSGESSSESSSKASSKSSSKETTAAPVACNPAQLKPVLSGSKRYAQPKQTIDFGLAFVNQSTSTCTVTLSGDDLELKIYSGTDRIWSTDDCSTAIKQTKATLAPQKAISLKLSWNGRRSAKSCKLRPEIPRPGTYFATSQLEGAKPVQFRIILRS